MKKFNLQQGPSLKFYFYFKKIILYYQKGNNLSYERIKSYFRVVNSFNYRSYITCLIT